MATLIPANEMKITRRHSDSDIQLELETKLATIRAGRSLTLKSTFGSVPIEDHPKVANIIRKTWAGIRADKPTINWTEEGYPKVSYRKQ